MEAVSVGMALCEVLHVWEDGIPLTPLPKWPVARPQLATFQERMRRPELRQAYTWYMQQLQQSRDLPILPGCTWCGAPTGMFCDYCEERPAKAVCTTCCSELDDDICRGCSDDGNDRDGEVLRWDNAGVLRLDRDRYARAILGYPDPQ